MPAKQLGDIPLRHLAITKIDDRDIDNLNKFSERHGIKRATLIRKAIREFLAQNNLTTVDTQKKAG